MRKGGFLSHYVFKDYGRFSHLTRKLITPLNNDQFISEKYLLAKVLGVLTRAIRCEESVIFSRIRETCVERGVVVCIMDDELISAEFPHLQGTLVRCSSLKNPNMMLYPQDQCT